MSARNTLLIFIRNNHTSAHEWCYFPLPSKNPNTEPRSHLHLSSLTPANAVSMCIPHPALGSGNVHEFLAGRETSLFEGKTRERERYRKERRRRMKTNNGTRKNNLTRLVCRTWNTALDDTFLFLFIIQFFSGTCENLWRATR